MENIFKRFKSKSSGELMKSQELTSKPETINLTKKFLIEMKGLSHMQKINLIYSNLTGKKPDVKLDINKKLDRILFEQTFGKEIKETKEFLNGKNKFKLASRIKRLLKSGNKKRKQILVWYLNAKGEIEDPKLHPIYSSDMIIIDNKPHQVDPRAFWRWGKYQVLIIKEIDRRPVSNLDYDEIKSRGDSTTSDEFIIKAAMQAVIGGPKKKPVNKTMIIIIGVIALIAIIYFMT
jgi:hypothetical protein